MPDSQYKLHTVTQITHLRVLVLRRDGYLLEKQ